MSNEAERFSAKNPCPICGSKDQKCSRFIQSGLINCRENLDIAGYENKGLSKNGAHYIYRKEGERKKKKRKSGNSEQFINWNDVLGLCQRDAETFPQHLKSLADKLKLPREVFDLFPFGIHKIVRDKSEYEPLGPRIEFSTGAERNGEGEIVGVGTRVVWGKGNEHDEDGKKRATKKCVTGSNRGIITPTGYRDRPGPILIPEGASDTAALLAAGLCSIGRAAARDTRMPKYLAGILKDWPADRGIIIVGDNDEKRERDGQKGAVEHSRELSNLLGRKVDFALPPSGFKDTRDWLTDDARASTPWDERGKELLAWIEKNLNPIIPEINAKETAEDAYSGVIPWSVHQHGIKKSPYPWGRFQFSDSGNSNRFIHMYGKDVLYISSREQWMIWDGFRWVPDETLKVNRLVRKSLDALWLESQDAPNPEAKAKAMQWWKDCEAFGKGEVSRKGAEFLVCASQDEFDKPLHLVNATNGTVDLRTGDLLEPDRNNRMTFTVTVPYDPDAKCPLWEKTIDRILPLDHQNIKMGGNEQMISFLHNLLGYCLTGETNLDIFPIFQGGGSNGKSTIVNIVRKIMGHDYSMMAPRNFLVKKQTQEHSVEVAQLNGKRVVFASEVDDGQALDMGFIKSQTGGDAARARGMFKEFSTFDQTHKLILLTNPLPKITGSDDGSWRRITLVPFKTKFWNPDKGETGPEETKRDETLESRLVDEMPGIFAWMVRGAVSYYRNGCKLFIPEEVRMATNAYRCNEDAIQEFLTECTIKDQESKVAKADLYKAYVKWVEDNSPGRKPLQNRSFSTKMGEKGFKMDDFLDRDKNVRVWSGIRIKTNQQVFDSDSLDG